MAGFIDRIGYDPVVLGNLSAGRILQPGGPVFGAVLTAPEFEEAVRAAKPAADVLSGAMLPDSGARSGQGA